MKKIILKFKMRQVIVFMSILSIVFTCIIAGIGITTSRKINDNVQWIYNYYGWGNLVDNMIINLKDMQINRLEAIQKYSNESLNKLEKLNDEFITNYYEYNDPEDGEQGEKETEFLNNTYVAYEEYYQVNLDIINQIKNSEKVDNNLVNRSVELEKIMMDNLNGLEEYLVSWAELDKNDTIIFDISIDWPYESENDYYKVLDLYQYQENFNYYEKTDTGYNKVSISEISYPSKVASGIYIESDDADTYLGSECDSYKQTYGSNSCLKFHIKLNVIQK